MNFNSAVKELKKGLAIRRACCVSGVHMKLDGDSLKCYIAKGLKFVPHPNCHHCDHELGHEFAWEDVTATDWKLF